MNQGLNHIAFIPDGNRRFAKAQGITSFEGHQRGVDQFRKVLEWCKEFGVREASFWGFSTENWNRTQEEVGYLMDLFTRMLRGELKRMINEKIRIRVIGSRKELPAKLVEAIEEAEKATADFTEYSANILLNYGGRPEFMDAMKKALRSGMREEDITEESVNELLWSGAMGDVDLIVRTSGEQRLSGFLPWKGNYAELYFSPKAWPEFDKEDLRQAIDWYQDRERRFGGDSAAK